ncbi:MAG TPA: potassium-transporting ATPase subunit C [Gemmataceae bacterium]|nr:potassium-transporting ATPase subunit C [Gemmataceae bacterium]
MLAHIRACLWLLALTVVVCCVLYPLALWAVGQGLFRSQAQGSLVADEKGQVRGSRLIAQKFSDDRFFQPRPSAAGSSGYDASASGGSNLAASNPLLRDRVARQLGPIARYEDGKRVGPDVEAWFRANPGLLGTWAKGHPTLAQRWVKDDANKKSALRWVKDHPDLFPELRSAALEDIPLDDVAVAVLTSFAAQHPGAWPVPKDDHFEAVKPDPTGKEENTDLQAVLFDAWLKAHPEAALRKVPADMVTASGSGLDPHITLRNARLQLQERVAAARSKRTGRNQTEEFQKIDALLQRHAFMPFGGLAGGEPLVNVLEVNLELEKQRPAAR